MSAASPTLEHVLAALQALYHDPDTQAKKRANEWLEEFQHSVSLLASDCSALLALFPGRTASMVSAMEALGSHIVYGEPE